MSNCVGDGLECLLSLTTGSNLFILSLMTLDGIGSGIGSALERGVGGVILALLVFVILHGWPTVDTSVWDC